MNLVSYTNMQRYSHCNLHSQPRKFRRLATARKIKTLRLFGRLAPHVPLRRRIFSGELQGLSTEVCKVVTKHITDEGLRGFIQGTIELTGNEQDHMLNCQDCNDRFRTFLTSNEIQKDAKKGKERTRKKSIA